MNENDVEYIKTMNGFAHAFSKNCCVMTYANLRLLQMCLHKIWQKILVALSNRSSKAVTEMVISLRRHGIYISTVLRFDFTLCCCEKVCRCLSWHLFVFHKGDFLSVWSFGWYTWTIFSCWLTAKGESKGASLWAPSDMTQCPVLRCNCD